MKTRYKTVIIMRRILLLGTFFILSWAMVPSKAADTLPSRYTDTEFWRIVTDFSEPNGAFPYENFVSNEVSYQDILPDLNKVVRPGGAYLGVAPEQNFT